MKSQKNTFSKFLVFFFVSIIIVISPIIIFNLTLDLKLLSLTNENILSISNFVLYILGYVILFILYRKNKLSLKYIRFSNPKMNINHFLFVAIIIFSYFIVSMTFLPSTSEVIQRSKFEVILAWISIILVAPIFEEIFFRGILLEQLYTKYNHLTSALIGTLFFGLSHYQANQPEKIISAIFTSLIICEVFYITRNIYLCIWGHFIFNSAIWIFIALDKIKLLDLKVNVEHNRFDFPPLLIVSAISILVITFIWWLSNRYKVRNGEIINEDNRLKE